MNGTTYICNQNMPGSFVRTLISFDAGGNWEMLRPPTADTTGKLLECILVSIIFIITQIIENIILAFLFITSAHGLK